MFVLLVAHALAGTTVTALDSGLVTVTNSDLICFTQESGTVTASTTLTLTQDEIVDFTSFLVQADGKHGNCDVYLDTATLTLDGVTIWSQFIDTNADGESCCDWYLQLDYTPTDLTDQVLTAGTHTLTLTLTGEMDAYGEAIRGQVSVNAEHGRDWDDDGFDATIVGGDDCDD